MMDLLDAPLLKVSRPIAACSRCRSSKVRCDGKLPACSACERAGKARSCSGATDEFAKGKERSYVAALEAQCERLKRRVAEHRRALGEQQQQGGGRERSDIDDLVGDFGFLSVNATSRDFYGITSSTSFAGLLLAVSRCRTFPGQASTGIGLPDRTTATAQMKHYFGTLYPLCPLLPSTKAWTSLDAVYAEGGRWATPFDVWVVRLVLAVSCALGSRRADDGLARAAAGHVLAALGVAEDVIHPGSLAGIQSILLLTQFSMWAPGMFRTWYLVGMAGRVAADLGIHQEQPGAAGSEDARRTFWSLYSMDRYVSESLGRAHSFSDDSVNVPAPVATGSIFAEDITPALQLFEVRRLQSGLYQAQYFSGRSTPYEQHSGRQSECLDDWLSGAAVDRRLRPLFELEVAYGRILGRGENTRQQAGDWLSAFERVVEADALAVCYVDFERASTVHSLLLSAGGSSASGRRLLGRATARWGVALGQPATSALPI